MKNLYAALIVLLGTMFCARAQTANQYFFKAKTGVALEDMSSGTTSLIGTNADELKSASTAFFPFSFAGTSYDHFSVSEDGVVVLGNASYSPYAYDNYFRQSIGVAPYESFIGPVYPILLPWGEDLFTANGGIKYKITGTAPARKLVIEFKVKSTEDYTSTYNKTFQVWLFEGSNLVQFVYGNTTSDWYNSANIGIASSGDDYLSLNSATNTVSSTEVTSNSSSNYPNKAPLPVSGTSYLFSPAAIVETTPPPPTPPVVTTTPVAATVAITPQYCVSGQQAYTIYLGYGLQSVTLSTTVSGGNPPASGYTYSWSPATGLSSASVASPIASPNVTTTYTVRIADGNGNSTTKSVTVYVVDPRYGDNKFIVCKNGVKTICVSKDALEAQLATGALLGNCMVANTVPATAASAAGERNLLATEANILSSGMAIYPSPSKGMFKVQLPENAQSTKIKVYDISGKLVAQQVAGENQRIVEFNLTRKAPGVYLIKTINKDSVQTSKIVIQ